MSLSEFRRLLVTTPFPRLALMFAFKASDANIRWLPTRTDQKRPIFFNRNDGCLGFSFRSA